jgi:tripartite-type tricarboxylate transporter receptor subunit TctC
MKTRFSSAAQLAILLACCFASNQTYAQLYPTKPVRVIVPYPPGGVVDALFRTVGQQVSESLGQPLVVENKPGANTIIALEACAKAAPDGYTICTSSGDGMSNNPALYPTLPYDASKDFAPITQLVWVNGAIIGGGQAPFDTVKEMISYAKDKPGVVNFASFGVGSIPHIYLEWLKQKTGANIVHVPYKGSAQIIPALMSGEVHATFIAMGIVIPQIQAGKIKALATTSPRRSPLLPNVTTLAEQGLDPELRNWFGVFAPARTPATVVARLNAEFVKAMRSPRIQEFLKVQAYDAVANSPEEFANFLKIDSANAKQVLRLTGIRLENEKQ